LQYQTDAKNLEDREFGAVGLALDPDSGIMFVTYESSNIIEMVNARTMISEENPVTVTDATTLAGITFDQSKQKLYTVDRETNKLFVYLWEPIYKTLTLEGDTHKALGDLPVPHGAYGIALNENNGWLFVTDSTKTVHVYNTNDPNQTWTRQGIVDVNRGAVGIAVDASRNYLYTGGYAASEWHTFLVRTDINDINNPTYAEKDMGADIYVIGITPDEETGFVYTTDHNTTDYNDAIKVFNTADFPSDPCHTEGVNIYGPADIVVRGDVSYKPALLRLSKGYEIEPNDPCDANDCARPGDTITYTISYDANGHSVNDVNIIDYLPYEVSNSPNDVNFSEPNGAYDPDAHTVMWEIGDLGANDSGDVTVTVKVNKLAAPNGVIVNFCEMESGSTYNIAEVNTPVCYWCGSIIYVDANAPTHYKSGATWQSAYKDLQDALETAENCNCNEIWVAFGTYEPTVPSGTGATFNLVDGVRLYGGFSGAETSLMQRDLISNETILDGNDNSQDVVTGSDVNGSAIIDGFTIMNGTWSGIYCDSGSPGVVRCKITGNEYGVNAESSGLSISRCIVWGNGGHGIWTDSNNPTIKNNWIYENGSNGIYLPSTDAQTIVRNNTIVNNDSYGIRASINNVRHITNSIVWGNNNGSGQLANCTASYSCIEGDPVYDGNGNINTDPCFVQPDSNNYHLDPNVPSPCIDAGTNTGIEWGETDIDGEERRLDDPEVIATGNGDEPVVDMGADEFYWSPADFNDDGIVNFVDYAIFAEPWKWKTEDANVSLDNDNDVDYYDLARFCEDWLWKRGQPRGYARSMGGGGMGRSEGFGEGIYAPAPAEEQAMESESEDAEEPDPEHIKDLIESFEGMLTDEEVKEGLSEEEWEKYVESINGIIKWLKGVLEELEE
jgi:hypothetical protein